MVWNLEYEFHRLVERIDSLEHRIEKLEWALGAVDTQVLDDMKNIRKMMAEMTNALGLKP